MNDGSRSARTFLSRTHAVVLGYLIVGIPQVANAQAPVPPTDALAPKAPVDAAPAEAPVAPLPSRAQTIRRLNEQVASQQATLEDQRARIDKMEKDLARLIDPKVATPPKGAEATDPSDANESEGNPKGVAPSDDPRKQIVVSGYIQGDFIHSQASEDQVRQGGTLVNEDRFLIRRARLIAEREWKFAAGILEIDGNTTNGPSFNLQRAEAMLIYRGDNPITAPPLVSLTVGQFRIPFGAENPLSPRFRFFMERSTAMLAMFPTEIDLGVRLAGAVGWFRYSVAAMNGQPLGVRSFAEQDPNAAKDLMGRLGAVVKPSPSVETSFGFSALAGKGFHRETDATKGTVQWNDANGDGVFQSSEINAVAPLSTRASSNFNRFALAADLQVRLKSRIGWTNLDGAFYAASNMDRGLYDVDPVLLGRDTRHFGYMLSVLQEVTPWAAVGLRADFYNPDSDRSDYQGAIRVQPFDQNVTTISPLAAFVFENRARLLFQYDIIRDKFARDVAGVATDMKNDRFTFRLQVSL